jgi:anaphase-promoting complex subunit 4
VELVHENLLPALDRCSIIATSLRGLARYDDSSCLFDVPVKDFTVILDILRCLRLLGHYILQYAAEERRQFLVFSKWLRHEIDVQATDPNSASSGEMLEKDPGVNYSQLLAYIQGALSNSHLIPFLRRNPTISDETSSRKAESPAYEDLSKALERYKVGTLAQKEILDIWAMFIHLHNKSRDAFSRIARWQTSNTTMSSGLILEDETITEARDMRMVFEVSLAIHVICTPTLTD